MVSKSREVGVRLSVKDEAVVKRALTELGKDGQAALKRIEFAAKPASTSLLALNAAAGRAKVAISGFAAGVAAGLLPFLSVAAAINGAKEALDQFDAIAKDAKATGLNPETYQEFAYAADLGGVAAENFAGAMETFAKNTGLASEGKGRLVSQLKALNPELLRSLQLTTDQGERLKLVADALDAEADSSKKAATASALFGDQGTRMVEVLKGGRSALEATAREARQLGIVISADVLARAEELSDKFSTASKVLDLNFKQVLIDLAPLLVGTAQLAGFLASAVRQLIDSFKDLGDQSTATLESRLSTIKSLIAEAQGPMSGYQTSADGQITPVNPMAVSVDDAGIDVLSKEAAAIEAVLESRKKLAELPSVPPSLPPADDAAKQAIKEAEALIKRLRTETETYADTIADLQGKLDAGLITQEMFNRGQAEAALKFAKAADDADEYAAALARIEEAHRQGLITELQYTDAVDSLTKRRLTAQNDWAAGIQLGLLQIKDGAKDVATDVASAVTGWADQLGDQIAKAAQTGKFAWQDLVKSMLADLAKLATQQLITRPLAGLLGSVAGSLFGGGGFGSLGNDIGSGASFGQLSAFKVGLADGTDNWRGGPTWVGERGPEILNLPRGSQVIPNHKIGGTNVTLAPTYQINGSNLSQSQLMAAMEANNDRLLSRVSDVVKGDIAKGKWG